MHRLLARQLKKLGLDEGASPKAIATWREFLQVVGRTYTSDDEDRARLERSLDVSSREMHERTLEIKKQAFVDKLTGLNNRALFMDRLEHSLTSRRRPKGVAIIFIDLDNFKLVNDSFGHAAGDHLLITVAERLMECVRPGDTVARLGGDEFTILLEELHTADQAAQVASRILRALKAPIDVGPDEVLVGSSIGISYVGDFELSADQLLKNADTAMYRAKASGGSNFLMYSGTMETDALERLELEVSLRKATEANEISIVYQPIVDLMTGEVSGAEVLARWTHPTKGPISPSLFIPVAEETGLIIQLGYNVLETACREFCDWQKKFQRTNLTLSVNLSVRQLQRGDAVERVAAILQKTGFSAQCLNLEITESVLISDKEIVVEQLLGLKQLGAKIAIDDFGTGYSSLAILTWLPVDTVKIDRSFVMGLNEEHRSSAIIEAILALARTMKFRVVGEGVESEYQRDVIRSLGCSSGQGYFFDRPLSARDFEMRLAKAASHRAA